MASSILDCPFQIFNPAAPPQAHFPQFRKLPQELRQAMWKQVLAHERLLHIELEYDTENKYKIVLEERWAISKLFRVSCESRATALSFYRVQLPCKYCYGGQCDEREDQGVLYLNPDLDILCIKGSHYFAQFAHDVWTHDRRHVGVVNLALPIARPRPSHGEWEDMPITALPLLQEALSRLERVIFIFPGDRGSSYTHHHRYLGPHPAPMLYYARPIVARVPGFDRLPRDPRDINPYLGQVYLCHQDPRDVIERWFLLLKQWQVEYDYEVDYQFMVTYMGCKPELTDREDVIAWVRGETECRTSWLQRKYKRHENRQQAVKEELESTPMPVAGFWLFPLSALGSWDDSVRERRRERRVSLQTTDLSKHTPQLCLSHIP
ncbi:hypothetical protein F66182_5134 [Fusarium sp. NRRL 66182]|nr:hypothetical protein F66182_5134 [Fusarium sp. NRRL 66182]